MIQWLLQLAVPEASVLVGSTAALATLLFAAPAAPLGVPYNTICGHVISICIALIFHWLQQLLGVSLGAHVIAPSLAIGVMTWAKTVNPPAAACAFIFLTSARMQALPLLGATFLLAPALAGCCWALLVQCALAKALALLKARRSRSPARAAKATRLTVTVDLADKAVATCIAQAVEGCAYVNDPLDFVIEALSRDRARLHKKASSVVSAFRVKKAAPGQLTRDEAAARLQNAGRKMIAVNAVNARRGHLTGQSLTA